VRFEFKKNHAINESLWQPQCSFNMHFGCGTHQANACRLPKLEAVSLMQVTVRIFYSTATRQLQ